MSSRSQALRLKMDRPVELALSANNQAQVAKHASYPFVVWMLVGVVALGVTMMLCSEPVHAQQVEYGSGMADYQKMKHSGMDLDNTSVSMVRARNQIYHAIRDRSIVDIKDLRQADGTVKLPDKGGDLVVRVNYSDVEVDENGQVRIASPVIQGNVNGNVTLYVEGEGVENITVLNGPGKR